MRSIPPTREDTVKTLLMAALICSSAAALAQPIAYRGLPLGSPKAELLKQYPDLVCKPSPAMSTMLGQEACKTEGMYTPTESARPLFSYGGRPVTRPTFYLIDGRFESFTAAFSPANYTAIRNALEEAHGAGKERTATLQTMGGASIESKRWSHAVSGGTFALLEHGTSIEFGALQISSDRYLEYSQRKRTGDPKEGAKDL